MFTITDTNLLRILLFGPIFASAESRCNDARTNIIARIGTQKHEKALTAANGRKLKCGNISDLVGSSFSGCFTKSWNGQNYRFLFVEVAPGRT